MNSNTAKRIRTKLFHKQHGLCIFCKCSMKAPKSGQRKQEDNYATLEHIVPRSEGGTNDESNFAVSCFACNSVRRSMPFEEFVQIISEHGSARNYVIANAPIRQEARAIRCMRLIIELAIIGLWIDYGAA